MSETIKYKRLPGRGLRTQGPFASGRCTMWLGPDHVLTLDRMWVNEEYKRFYFRDIQAITVQRTQRGSAWNWAFASLVVVTTAIIALIISNTATAGARNAWWIADGIICGFWFILGLVNTLRGPTCRVKLRTAVQTEELPSLKRVRTARRAIAILKPLIEEKQGRIAQEETAKPEFAAAIETASRERKRVAVNLAPTAAEARAMPAEIGRSHWLLFAMMMLDAVKGFARHFTSVWVGNSSALVGIGTILAVTVLAIRALMSQRKARPPGGIGPVTVIALISNIVSLFGAFLFVYIARVRYVMMHPGHAVPQTTDLYAIPGFWTMSLIADSFEFCLGAVGLVMAVRFRVSQGKPAGAGVPPATETPGGEPGAAP